MCGRDYSTYTDLELELRYMRGRPWRWPLDIDTPSVKPNFNMCPTQSTLVLNVKDGKLGLREMRWGLVPGWAKTVKDADKYSMINAKGEEIAEKRSYKSAFQKRRCIVPVSGFFEWKRNGQTKTPFAIHLIDEPIMSLAAVWEHWEGKTDGEIVDSFALITTSANSFMTKIHDRMPVILNKDDEENWLDPEIDDPKQLSSFLRACPSEWLEAFEITKLVNSPKNNFPEVLRPVDPGVAS